MIRILPTEKNTVFFHLAYDEACMKAVKEERVAPTMRLYTYSEPATTIGYFQRYADEIKENTHTVARRIAGGGCWKHQKEIMYSIIAPESYFSQDIQKSYGQIIKPLMQALRKLGKETHYTPLDKLRLASKICAEHAQTRKDGILLQQGRILLADDAQENTDAYCGVGSYEQVHDAIREEYKKAFRAEEGTMSSEEREHAQELVEKYASEEWNTFK